MLTLRFLYAATGKNKADKNLNNLTYIKLSQLRAFYYIVPKGGLAGRGNFLLRFFLEIRSTAKSHEEKFSWKSHSRQRSVIVVRLAPPNEWNHGR